MSSEGVGGDVGGGARGEAGAGVGRDAYGGQPDPRELEQFVLDDRDLPLAQALVIEASWNQVEDDWRIFLSQGRVLGLRARDGGLAASAAILPYRDSGFGWISMVLVAKRWRRLGLATRLLGACIDMLQAEGLVPVLDATPAGRTVYGPLGFRDGWAISRWKRMGTAKGAGATGAPGIAGTTGTTKATAPTCAPGSVTISSLDDGAWQGIEALDLAAFGGHRISLLAALAKRSGGFACVAGSGGAVTGFLLGRNGRTATQLGPIVAENENIAVRLLDYALERENGAVQVDALDTHARFSACLAARGFEVERPYTRMTLRQAQPYGDARRMIAIAGPELG